MSEEYTDPSGNTDQFKAFVQADTADPTEPAARRRLPLIIGVAVAAVVVIAVVAMMASA